MIFVLGSEKGFWVLLLKFYELPKILPICMTHSIKKPMDLDWFIKGLKGMLQAYWKIDMFLETFRLLACAISNFV